MSGFSLNRFGKNLNNTKDIAADELERLLGLQQQPGADSGFGSSQPDGGDQTAPNPSLQRLFGLNVGDGGEIMPGGETQNNDWRSTQGLITLNNTPQDSQMPNGGIMPATQEPAGGQTQQTAAPQNSFRNNFFGTSEQEAKFNQLFGGQNQNQFPAALSQKLPVQQWQSEMTREPIDDVDQLPGASQERDTDRYLREIRETENSPGTREHSVLKRILSGIWNGFKTWGEQGAQGGIGGLVGALGAGAATFGVSPEAQTEFKKNQKIKQLRGKFEQAAKSEEWQAKRDKTEAEAEWTRQRPVIEQNKVDVSQQKADTDARYKDEVIQLGTQKASELKIYRDAIVQLKERGADQNDQRIKLLEATLEERKRANQQAEKDKDLDRDARIKVAQIMTQGRIDVANIQQDGQNNRTMIDSADKARAVLSSIEKQGLIEQGKNGWSDEETRKKIDEKKKQILDGLSQEVRSSLNL